MAVVPEEVTRPRPDPKPVAPPSEVTRRTVIAATPADVATLKQACAQAAGLLALARAKPADPIPLMVAAAALASSVKSPAKSETGRDAGRSPAIASASQDVEPAITGLRLCRKVMGLGSFEAVDHSQLRPGQPALLYCERTGLGHEEKAGLFVSRLSSRVELVSAAHGKTVWELPMGEARDESRSRSDTCYVNYRMSFPRSIMPGDYRLRLIHSDLVAGRTVSCEIPVAFIR
jgi:hypothetical protein